jgi:FecR protein
MLKLEALLAAALLAVVPSLALADSAGSALGVKQQANAQLSGDTRTLRVGSDIFIGDLVKTGPQGQVQILFGDNTELVLGPSASLTIEDYLIRNDGSAGKLAVDILSGAFRFATGDSAKNRYTIDTPTGTIGVRGTEFDGWIGKDGIPYIIRHGGTVILCTNGKDCDVLDDVCEVGKIGAKVEILGDARQSTGDIRATYKKWFRYTENQSPLLRRFWFVNARDCLNAKPHAAPDPHDDNGGNNNGGGNPDTPEKPDTPDTPDAPDTPDTPDTPPTSNEPPPTSSEPPSPPSEEPPTSSEPPPTSSEPPAGCGNFRVC